VTLTLNGKSSSVTERISNVIVMIKERAPEHLRSHSIEIVSENNFNTAAGLASSASGLSCLAFALFKVYGIEANREEISMFARLGSGSACRSLEGGFVQWHK
jgi:diphosphomevalonate decarboxylase